ncbi:MAG: hypothetical protein ABGY42_06445 [bacterium]
MVFAATIFVSAFLLFQVQPMVGKYILPWFGSTPGVWTTALLFFQLMLLAGYAYAHFVVSRLTWRRQAVVHAVDAFSSDAIPIHLLTQESFQTYLAHLQEDGILAIHVTNRHVDLAPIVGRVAEATGLTAIYIENSSRDSRFVSSTDWILLTSNRAFLAIDAVREDEEHMPEPGSLWTDDFSSVFEVVEFGN